MLIQSQVMRIYKKSQLLGYHLIQSKILSTKTINNMWQVVERITNGRDLGSGRVKLDDAVTPSTGFQSGREGND